VISERGRGKCPGANVGAAISDTGACDAYQPAASSDQSGVEVLSAAQSSPTDRLTDDTDRRIDGPLFPDFLLTSAVKTVYTVVIVMSCRRPVFHGKQEDLIPSLSK